MFILHVVVPEEGAGSDVPGLLALYAPRALASTFVSFHLAPHHKWLKLNKTFLMMFPLGNACSVEWKIFGKLCQLCQISERGQYLATRTRQLRGLHLPSSCGAKGPPRQPQAHFAFSQNVIFKIPVMFPVPIYFALRIFFLLLLLKIF